MERSPGRWLAAAVASALVIRAVALLASMPTGLAGDEPELFVRSARIALGRPLADDTARAPGILYYYAAVFTLAKPWAVLAKWANVLVGSLSVLPAYALGVAYGGRRVGLVGALLMAGYPTFIAFSHFLWSATLYVFLMASATALVVWSTERRALLGLCGAGVLFGLSALTKESGFLFPLAVAGWVAFRDRSDPARAALRCAVLLIAFAVTLVPWVVHINAPGRPFAVVTRTGYMNLYIGNHARSHGHAMAEYPGLGATAAEREARAKQIALANIRERMPWWPLEKLGAEVPRFFTPTNFAVRRLLMPPGDPGRWGYVFAFDAGNRSGPRLLAVVLSVAAYVSILLAGVAGLILSRRRDQSVLYALFILSQLGASVVTFSMSRFRVPAMLFLLLGAASLCVWGRRDWRAASGRRRAAALVCVTVMAGLVAMGYESVLRSTGG